MTSARPAPRHAAAVTPDDDNDLADSSRSLYVVGAGDVVVDMGGDGDMVTFSGVPAGTVLPVSVRRVHATGTTATDIVALW